MSKPTNKLQAQKFQKHTTSLILSIFATASWGQGQAAKNEFIACQGPCILINTREPSYIIDEREFNHQLNEKVTVSFITSGVFKQSPGTDESPIRNSVQCKTASAHDIGSIKHPIGLAIDFFKKSKSIEFKAVYVCDISNTGWLSIWTEGCAKKSGDNMLCGPFGSGSEQKGMTSAVWATPNLFLIGIKK